MPLQILTTLSLLLQVFAAFLALRLIFLTGKRSAWVIMTAALLLMAFWRIVEHTAIPNLATSMIVEGIISILWVVGIWRIRSIFVRLKRAEATLAHEKNYYQSLFINNASVMLLVDPDTADIVDANSAASKFYGYPLPDLTSKKIFDISTTEQPDDIFANLKLARTAARQHFTFDDRLANGEIRRVEVYSGPITVNDKTLVYAIIHDITEQQHAIDALKKLTHRVQLVLNATHEGIYGLDTNGEIVFINKAAERMTGWQAEEIHGKFHHSLVHHTHPDGTPYPPEKCPVHNTIHTGKTHYIRNEVFWRKNGTYFPVAYTSAPIIDDDDITGAVVTFRDITREQAAEITRVRLETAIEQSADSVFITDTMGTIQYVNPAFERITGYSHQEAIGQNPRILKSGKHDLEFYENLWNTITAGRTWHGQFINKRKNGDLYNEDAIISPVFDETGKIINFVAVKRDITEQLHMETQLRQSQKMEALGRLVGEVAHDFNNVLTAVNGFAELLMRRLNDDTNRQYADSILQSGKRAADLIRQLMAFSRRQISRPETVNINHVLAEMEPMLSRVLRENISLSVTAGDNLAQIMIDPTQLQQIILNLVVNARDAMPHGGKISIRTENVTLDDAYVAAHIGASPGEHVLISVADTGTGIPEEIQDKIFEPFFTTKPEGKGTGLGLSTVFGIVKQHSGNIWLYSELGKGTEFKLYFPTVENIPEDSPLPGSDTSNLGAPSHVQVLVVEDNEIVRTLAKDILTFGGYSVITAASAEDVLAMDDDQLGKTDVLLTDIVLPGMNGKELADALSARYEQLVVVYMSGYSHDIIAEQGIIDKNTYLVEKPFSGTTLLATLAEAIMNHR